MAQILTKWRRYKMKYKKIEAETKIIDAGLCEWWMVAEKIKNLEKEATLCE